MKKYVIQIYTRKRKSDYRLGWVTLDSKQYDTLEEARAAYNKILFKSDYRIAEAYTVVRYKPVK